MDTVIADMQQSQDFVLAGYESQSSGWYVGATVQAGNIANTSNFNAWWQGYNVSGAYSPPVPVPLALRAILPWMVHHQSSSHAATNVRIGLRNMRCYIQRADNGVWELIGSSAGVSGFNTPYSSLFGGSEAADIRTLDDGSVEVKAPNNPAMRFHGWWNAGRPAINPDNIRNVFVTIQGRLVVDDTNMPDDRSSADLGINVGADYYIDTSTNWPGPNAGVGVSRVKRLTNSWQSFSFITVTGVALDDPGGGSSEAQLRADPPPLD
jgi:hypothetical protein